MKKIILLLLLSLSFSSYAQFPENFDSEIPSTWAIFLGENGLGATRTWEHDSNGYALVLWDADTNGGIAENWLVTPKFEVSAAKSVMTFLLTDLNPSNYGSNITVRVSDKSSQTTIADFTTKLTVAETDIVSSQFFQPFSVDLSEFIGSEVYVAFVMTNNDGDAWVLDEVDLVPNASVPNPVTNPLPTDGEADVIIDVADGSDYAVDFSWVASSTGDAATSFDVYLGESSTALTLLGNTSNLAVSITGMEYSTTYYWQIVAKNVGGNAVGSEIWSFTTESDPTLSIVKNDILGLSIYPNPSKNVINIKSDNLPTKVSIYNLLGKQIKVFDGSQLTDGIIDISNLSKGVYLMKITINEATKTIRIMKE
jgi:hypothetical protein